MNKHCRTIVALFGLAGTLSVSAGADPPAPVSAPLPVPGDAPTAPPLSAAAPPQMATPAEAARASLQSLAQQTEREATRQARGRQFDQAQRLYAKAASLYHQQARLARRSAQEMTKANQMSLAARAHAEALRADNRFLACLASEVSAIKKSSLADALPAKHLPPVKRKTPVLSHVALAPSVPVPRPVNRPAVNRPLRIAALPASLHKPKAAGAMSASARGHAARARKLLLPMLQALAQAAAKPLGSATALIASQQHGLLQEELRLRRVQLQSRGAADAVPPSDAPPGNP